MGTVAVVGSFNVDHAWRVDALPAPGETRAGRYASGPGGKGFNQAVAARRSGADVRFVCALGDDAGGRMARALCEAEGIDLVAAGAGQPTGTAGIYVDAQGRNCIVVGAGANGCLEAAFVEQALGGLDASALLLVQLEVPLAAVHAALAMAGRRGARTVLNPAPANVRAADATLALADLLVPNETEFSALLANHLDARVDAAGVAALDDDQLHAWCRRLLPGGTVVVTLGAAGSFVSHADAGRHGDDRACYRVEATPARPVDTTGAGDAFIGALCSALARMPGAPFIEPVRFASGYAARAIERVGAALAMPRG